MAAVVAAGLLGLCGGGPLSRAHARAALFAVRYERISRVGLPEAIRVELAPGAAPRLRIGEAYLEGARILEVSPPPHRVVAADGERSFEFEQAAGTRRPLRVVLRVEHRRAGLTRLAIAAGDRAPLRLAKLVLP